MPKTGNIFTDIFSFVSIGFPLLPVAIIFIKKNFRSETLNFLMLLCLMNFVKSLLLFMLQLNSAAQNLITNIFTLFEFILLIQLLKKAFPDKIKKPATIFLIVFLSAVLTDYLLLGLTRKIYAFEQMQSAIIISISIVCIAKLIAGSNLNIFNEPLFWISAGSLFYFSISILMEALSWYYAQLSQESLNEKEILLGIGSAAKYFFYTMAVFLYPDHTDEKENSSQY